MDYFGPKDLLQMVGHNEGISPGPDPRQQLFLDKIKAYQMAQNGQTPPAAAPPTQAAPMAPMGESIATGGPLMAGPSTAVQTVAAAMPQAPIGQPMQPMQQKPMMGGFAGVALPRFG